MYGYNKLLFLTYFNSLWLAKYAAAYSTGS